jgi:hypothetical protein
MKKISLIFSMAIVASTSVFLIGCRKDKNETLETIVSAEDNSTAENEFTSLFDVADDFSSNDRRTRAGNTILPSGAIVTFQDSSYTDGDGVEATIDFGPIKNTLPKGKICQDGRFRAGKIHISSNRRYFLDSAEVVITVSDSDKYYAGNDGVSLTQLIGTVKIKRVDAATLTIDVLDARAINDKGTVAWQSTRTISKLVDAGAGILGDQFQITGEASGVNRNGENYTVKIDVPLLKKVEMGCARTFVKGKITLSNTSTGKTISIDYDPYNDQACDLFAKATINGKEYFYTVR